MVETFGPRLWGSLNLEAAIQYLNEEMKKNYFDNPRLELVPNITNWTRGKEHLTLLSPHPTPTNIPMIGLGKSVGGNVTAEVIVVHSFDELEQVKDTVSGKIVLYNFKWEGYGKSVQYRVIGANRASKYGAIGCLIRSVAPITYETPHTGTLYYDDTYPRIPAAAISIESALMIDHNISRGKKVLVNLYMEAQYHSDLKDSHNVVGEILGSEKPNEIIVLGGHIDSWDTGPQTGANDDAGGVMVCFEAIRLLIKLGLRPKRTLRFVAWSGEEFGDSNSGANAYVRLHRDEMKNHILGFESDLGTTHLKGFGFTGSQEARESVRFISKMYLSKLNLTKVTEDGESQDVSPFYDEFKIPIMNNFIDHSTLNEDYFRTHHSAIDNMSALDPEAMDENVRGIATMLYIIADLESSLPK
jgi:carboxypeptidase Q